MFVYWNGRKFDGLQGCTFEGNKRSIRIERGVGYNTLKRKIAAKLKLQSHQTISSLTYRFPISRESNTYTALEIVDDDDVDCMISTFEQRSPLTVLELYAEIDIAGSSLLPIAPSIRSGVASGGHFSADVCLSDEDEDYVRDLSSDESEDDDEGEILDSDSSEAEMDFQLLQFLLLHHLCILENNFHNKAVSFCIIICIYCDFIITFS